MLKTLVILNLVVAAQAFAAGVTTTQTFGEGNQSYETGNYAAASEKYEAVLQAGNKNGHVYFNLGNARFRQGKKGEAIAAYLAAKRLLPRDPDISANLDFALKGVADKLDPTLNRSAFVSLFFWTENLTTKEQVYFGAALLAFGALLWALSVFAASLHAFRNFAIAIWFFAMVCMAGLSVAASEDLPWAAVTANIATVYSGPSKTANSAVFELHEGAPVAIDKVEGDWYKIRLSDNKRGWINASDVRFYH